MRLRMLSGLLALAALSASLSNVGAADPAATGFVHPGLLHSAGDLARMKQQVRDDAEPWAGAWQAFSGANNRWIQKSYRPRPLVIVGRGVGATGQDNISNDCTAAYYNAIAWAVTGDEAYARKSIEIMNAWASTCREINGKDAVLCAGIYGYKLMNAAEIMRHSYGKWPDAEVKQFERLAREVFYPVVKDFSTFANGNWDAAAVACVMATGVFLDDRPMFDRAARYYLDGSGDGTLLHYIISDTGQLQETGRDQGHAQLGIGLLSCAAEMAWHQGIDLYGAYDNRLLKGFEYTARYNLGEDVPFEPTTDRTGKYVHTKASVRGPMPPTMQIYEMVYNHYVNRAGIPAPYTARAAAARRPESLAIDQVGGGTLLFSLPPYHAVAAGTVPAMPGPILARGRDTGVALLWAASVGADHYTVKRAGAPGGPFKAIAEKVKGVQYTDKAIEPGRTVYYTVSAANARGSGPDTLPAGACAGLPSPWAQQDVGETGGIKGYTLYDGETFTLEAAGMGMGGTGDELHFANVGMSGDGSVTARYVPQTPSQFARMGISMRAGGGEGGAAHVSVLITPEATADIEVPRWHLALVVRKTKGGETESPAIGPPLEAPVVTWGRLMAPLWLRLTRSGDTFTAASSTDGITWTPLGSTTVALPRELRAGLAACSHIQNSTTVMFDHVAAPGWPGH